MTMLPSFREIRKWFIPVTSNEGEITTPFGSSILHQATVTLDNDQIKGLPLTHVLVT